MCYEYFDRLYEKDPNWFNDYSNLNFDNFPQGSQTTTNNIAFVMERLRVYETCFVINRLDISRYKITKYDTLDYRMFPFINLTYLENDVKYHYDHTKSVWLVLLNANKVNKKKRGIVLSVGEDQVEDALRLINTLSATDFSLEMYYNDNDGNNNGLIPIQIVHKGDLSQSSIDLFKNLGGKLNKNDLDIEVINASNFISPQYIGKFTTFLNKWLAVLFNTFDREFILLDADVILFTNPYNFFNIQEYLDNGNLFFRDRSIMVDKLSQNCVDMFEAALPPPSQREAYFKSEKTIEYQVYKEFFHGGYLHQLESGLVVINKQMHYFATVISTILNLSNDIGECAWGDKEYFWLGFLALGNNSTHNYKFYPNEASGVGEEIKQVYNRNVNIYDKRICSVQVGHTSYADPETHLLWLNGGAYNCKFHDNIKDLPEGITEEGDNSLGDSIIKINSYIIPDRTGVNFFRENWACNGYNWCARYYELDNVVHGEWGDFNPKEIEWINSILRKWGEYPQIMGIK
ncbi:alpha-mannosyltransferase SCDLUD_004594 [Saccharomycodes ludwigii]|uniref:alpha-mannosyltransferase n=1 Tax=Saccharomycodes ludwigii TaxID=36035 RepID=UPI001E82DA49|nr:hypothetical protein SCDLUD_004594 [Saccharomycodes ludwigii]KAH3899165.1 hypothetical protein SCDLUD_004594 [Saccharomycodes ludwigii]